MTIVNQSKETITFHDPFYPEDVFLPSGLLVSLRNSKGYEFMTQSDPPEIWKAGSVNTNLDNFRPRWRTIRAGEEIARSISLSRTERSMYDRVRERAVFVRFHLKVFLAPEFTEYVEASSDWTKVSFQP